MAKYVQYFIYSRKYNKSVSEIMMINGPKADEFEKLFFFVLQHGRNCDYLRVNLELTHTTLSPLNPGLFRQLVLPGGYNCRISRPFELSIYRSFDLSISRSTEQTNNCAIRPFIYFTNVLSVSFI